MKIKIAKPENELIGDSQLLKNLNSTFLSGNYIGGKNVQEFEDSLGNYLNVKYVASLNSGTDALLLSLLSLGIKKGDEVILPSFTYFATVETVLNIGAVPVFADLDENSFTTSSLIIEKLITKKTKCIIPVHLFGYDCDIENVVSLAKHFKIPILEDTAQAFGSKANNKQFLGTFGEIGAFSNYPTKTLGGIGDGGFVATNNIDYFKKIKLLKNHGQSKTYSHQIPGYNSRLDSLNALVLHRKLKKFEKIKKSRNNFVNFYLDIFKSLDDIHIPKIKDNYLLNNFSIYLPQKIRNKFLNELKMKNIETRIYYPIPMHKQKAVTDIYNLKNIKLKNTEKASKSIISLPLYSFPTNNELNYLEKNIFNTLKKVGIK